jgi:hypothetical protein
MPASGRTVWKEWGSKCLAKLEGEKFVDEISPLLRLFHPDLQRNNIPGTHLTVWNDDGATPYAIQCQGFSNSPLGIEQARVIEEQVGRFIESGFYCEKYYVVHNNLSGFGGRQFTEFNSLVNNCLQKVCELGKAQEVALLDRSIFIKEVSQRLEALLEKNIRRKSEDIKYKIQARLRFSKYYVPSVPVSENQIEFKSYDLPNLKPSGNLLGKSAIAREVILSSSNKVRWILLHGEPGTGKTTTALQAATQKDKTVLFVPCELFEFDDLQKGTSILLSQIVRSLDLLEDYFSNEDREIILQFSGSTLANILEHSEDHALIFDGLDENRFYSDPQSGGLERLSSRLEDFDCPVILTTRTSHFKASYEKFSHSLASSPQPSHHRKFSRLLELSKWQISQVIQLIDEIAEDEEIITSEELKRILDFKQILKSGEYYALYGHLPCNPLFLQFILEDVINSGVQESNRISLIYRWIRSKIRRDLLVKTRSFLVEKEMTKIESYIDKILYLMEYTADQMTGETDDGYDLKEYVEFSSIESLILKVFNIKSTSLVDILLNSALTSQANLSGSHYDASKGKITFIFKIFHEYFLACFLVRSQKRSFGYPEQVREFYLEIKDCLEKDQDSNFSTYLSKPGYLGFQDENNATISHVLIEIDRLSHQMSDSQKPQNNYTFNAPINGPVGAGGEVKVGSLSYSSSVQDSSFVQALNDIKASLESLHRSNASASEEQYIEIIDAEFEDVRVNEPEKWAGWMNALKILFAGGIETAKAFNPWVGIPIELLRKAYEIHQEKHKSLPESR